jgi:hypothetical protein
MKKQTMSNSDFVSFLMNEQDNLYNEVIDIDLVSNITITTKYKTIENCTFNSSFAFEEVEILGTLKFINCTFNKKSNLHYSFTVSNGSLLIINCHFYSTLTFSHCSNSLVLFKSVIIKEQLRIDNCSNNRFAIEGIDGQTGYTSIKKVNCASPLIKNFTIKETIISEQLKFFEEMPGFVTIGIGQYEKIILISPEVKVFQIKGSDVMPDTLKISELYIPFSSLDGNIFIKNCEIDRLFFKSLNIQKGELGMFHVKIKDRALFTDSNLSGAIFNDISFKEARISFDRSHIDSTIFSNILWPDSYILNTESELLKKSPTSNYNDLVKKEAYRQLKNNSKKSSNHIEALKFYRNEMDEYWKYIKTSKDETWANRFLIGINKYVSDFGQNYWRPLVWLLGFHLVFFLVLFFTKFNFVFQFNTNLSFTSEAFNLAVGEFFRLINPAHKMAPEMKSWYVIIDMLMRISSGFFIYQFIRATRKFARL